MKISIEKRLQKLESSSPENNNCIAVIEWILSNYGVPLHLQTKQPPDLDFNHPFLISLAENIEKNYEGLPLIENVAEVELGRTEIEWARINRD